MTKPFLKPPKSFSEQIQILRDRGMGIADPEKAEAFLSWINYYRLTAYWLPFEQTHEPHRFRPGTTFERVKNIYMADRELRLLFLDAIERIEVAVRTRWAYSVAHSHGPHGYLETSLARDCGILNHDCDRLCREVDRSKEAFIVHLKQTYSESLPPIWAACEVMSLGLLSSWYGNLKPQATSDAIANAFQVQRDVLTSWVHHLSVVRNLCAHHGRLWNRSFTVTPRFPRNKPSALKGEFVTADPYSRKIYNTMLLTLHLLDVIAPGSQWRSRLVALLNRGDLNLSQMGFPAGWEDRPIWKGGASA